MTQTLRRDRDLARSRLKYEMAAYRVRLSMLALDEALSAHEEKLNPNHDPANGRFTSGGSGGGGATPSASSAAGLRNQPQSIKPSYSITGKDQTLNPSIQPQVDGIGAEFNRKTGRTMVVTSGYRNAEGQARAMYDKLQAGGDFSLYKNKAAAAEVMSAYEAAKASGADRATIVASMATAIQNQVERGIYVSLHLTSRAVDISTRDADENALTHDQIEILFSAIRKFNGKILIESDPPHIHVQFYRLSCIEYLILACSWLRLCVWWAVLSQRRLQGRGEWAVHRKCWDRTARW